MEIVLVIIGVAIFIRVWLSQLGLWRLAERNHKELVNKIDFLHNVIQWVAVEDRLPDDDRWVLTSHIVDEWVDRAEYNEDEGYWYNGECEIIVTHWKELPEPPCG